MAYGNITAHLCCSFYPCDCGGNIKIYIILNSSSVTVLINLELSCNHVKPNGIPLCYDNSYMPHMYIRGLEL